MDENPAVVHAETGTRIPLPSRGGLAGHWIPGEGAPCEHCGKTLLELIDLANATGEMITCVGYAITVERMGKLWEDDNG